MEQTSQILNQNVNKNEKQRPDIFIVNKKKKSKYQIHLKSFLSFIIFITFILIELFLNSSYLDEAFAIFALGYLLLYNKKINKYDIITFTLLMVIVFLGLISNWYSGVSTPLKSIGVDLVTQVKVILGFFFMKNFMNDKEKQATIELFVPIAKLFTIAAFLCGTISQFVNIGMTGEVRYGIKCFNFIFNFNFQYIATFLVLLGSIVCSKNITPKVKHRYYFMAVIAIMLNAKSQALIFGLMFISLYYILKKYKRLNLFFIILMGIALVFISRYQIDTYLSKEGAARHVFYEYAIKNAKTYFPFGSGFATYGSAEAAKNYSPLYFSYGFNNVWGMSPDFRAFLTDTYWASVLGQFGWIGLMLMIIVYLRVFRTMTSYNYSYEQRAFLYAAFAQYVIHAIGAGIITSSPGLIGFMAMALFIPNDKEMDKGILLPKVRIAF